MKFHPIERAADASQQSVSAEQRVAPEASRRFRIEYEFMRNEYATIPRRCERRRTRGGTSRRAATELGWGSYNNTYRVDIDGQAPVILTISRP